MTGELGQKLFVKMQARRGIISDIHECEKNTFFLLLVSILQPGTPVNVGVPTLSRKLRPSQCRVY